MKVVQSYRTRQHNESVTKDVSREFDFTPLGEVESISDYDRIGGLSAIVNIRSGAVIFRLNVLLVETRIVTTDGSEPHLGDVEGLPLTKPVLTSLPALLAAPVRTLFTGRFLPALITAQMVSAPSGTGRSSTKRDLATFTGLIKDEALEVCSSTNVVDLLTECFDMVGYFQLMGDQLPSNEKVLFMAQFAKARSAWLEKLHRRGHSDLSATPAALLSLIGGGK